MYIPASRVNIPTPNKWIALSLLSIALFLFLKIRFSTTTKPIIPADTKYQAPYDPGEPNHRHDLEYQQYEVILWPGYAIAQHKAFTGFLTDHHIPYSAKLVHSRCWKDSIAFFAMQIDDDQLDTIRSDPGVMLVGRVPKIHMVLH